MSRHNPPAVGVPDASDDAPDDASGAAPVEQTFPLDRRTLTPEALKAFAHPLRIAMYRDLSAHGRATASQIARRLGESTGQTSYHLRQLERHGFIEDDPDAPAGGRERWWRPVGFTMERSDVTDPASRLAAGIALRAVVQERAEMLQRWFDSFDSFDELDLWSESAMHVSSTSDLTPEESRALTQELAAVLDRHTEAAKQRKRAGETEGRRRVRAFLDVFPLPLDD